MVPGLGQRFQRMVGIGLQPDLLAEAALEGEQQLGGLGFSLDVFGARGLRGSAHRIGYFGQRAAEGHAQGLGQQARGFVAVAIVDIPLLAILQRQAVKAGHQHVWRFWQAGQVRAHAGGQGGDVGRVVIVWWHGGDAGLPADFEQVACHFV